MTTAEAIVAVVLLLAAGSVLHRALAARLLLIDEIKLGVDGSPKERDILFLGLLPALALIGTIGTCLAMVHLFRADVTVAVLLVLVLSRRRDAMATLGAVRALVADGWRAVCRFQLVTLAAVGALVALAACLLALAQLPSDNVDVWVFQLPLAESMVEHSGFAYPQIDDPFYGNSPLFFNLLFAQALLFVDHFIAADVVNIVIYLSFLLALLTYAPGARGFAFLLILYSSRRRDTFAPGASAPLTDLSRSCYSVTALLLTDRYLRDGRAYDLVIAGLLAGAAVAGKYTELVTVVIIGVCLIPRLLQQRRTWFHALGFSAALLTVAGFWYVKNWILLGNPIYPFVFGHPGLTDQWMAEYLIDIRQAFDPADRIYDTNLLTQQGWRDFAFILYNRFFVGQRNADLAAVPALVALVLRPRRMAMLISCTVALFIIWYTVMFNNIRWATPAYLLFFPLALSVPLSSSRRRSRVGDFTERGFRRYCRAVGRAARSRLRAFPALHPSRLLAPQAVTNVVAVLIVLIIGIKTTQTVTIRGIAGFQRVSSSWVNRDLLEILLDRTSVDDFLTARRQGYAIYRYVAGHDLRTVFQPFDSGATSYAAAYNGGHDGHWILGYRVMPADAAHAGEFSGTACALFCLPPAA